MSDERRTSDTAHRLGTGLAVATLAFLVVATGAVGIIGAGGRPDRVYLVVLAVAVGGAALARLRSREMVLAMAATALTQAVVTSAVLVTGLHGSASVVDIVGINAMFVVLFSLSAWLFARAAGRAAA